MIELKWSFDDNSIGQKHLGAATLQSHLLHKKPDMDQQEWYKVASNICHYLNQGFVTPAPALGLTPSELDAVLRAAFPTVRPEDMGDHVVLTLDQSSPIADEVTALAARYAHLTAKDAVERLVFDDGYVSPSRVEAFMVDIRRMAAALVSPPTQAGEGPVGYVTQAAIDLMQSAQPGSSGYHLVWRASEVKSLPKQQNSDVPLYAAPIASKDDLNLTILRKIYEEWRSEEAEINDVILAVGKFLGGF